MKIWITKNSEVTVRDQIVLQVQAGVGSGDLKPGDKLPSTRELSRRFGIHPNTVSAAYRKLVEHGTVDMRKGSGIFIRESGSDALDALISKFFRDAAKAGFSRENVLERVLSGGLAPIKGFSLFEPNDDLAEIMIYEIESGTGLQVERVYVPLNCKTDHKLIALFDEEPRIKGTPDACDCVFLNANSIAKSLTGRVRPKQDEIVAVVSGWPDFLDFARLFLLAAGLDPASVITISTRRAEWRRSLRTASMIICDPVAATKLTMSDHLIVFPVISTDSIKDLRRLANGNGVAPS